MFTDDPATSSCLIHLKVVPNSRRAQIVGPYADRLKVKVAAPPEDGRANKAVCELLADALNIPARDIEVIAGHASPETTIRVTGLAAAQCKESSHLTCGVSGPSPSGSHVVIAFTGASGPQPKLLHAAPSHHAM